MRAIQPFLALAALLLAACRPGAGEQPPLVVDAIGPRAQRAIVADAVSAGLTALDPAGRVVPALAQSWRVFDEGRSIVFRLRPAHFPDGTPIGATHAVAAIEAARKGKAGPQVAELLAGVTQVNAPLETVVEIQLSTPQPELLELLATPQLAIRSPRHNAGIGPFLLQAAPVPDAGEPPAPLGTRLLRNKDYFAADTVEMEGAIVASHSVEESIRRFNRGETLLVLGGGLDGLGTARVTAKRDTLMLERPRAGLLLLVNHRRPGLSERNVRRALQLAINRDSLAQGLFGTQAASPVAALSPGNIAGYTPPRPDWVDLPFASRQLEADRLLAEARQAPAATGDEAPPGLTFTVAVTSSPAEARLLTAVAADLAAIGVELNLARRSPEAHLKAIREGDFDLALVRRDTPIDSPLPFLLPNLCNRNRHGVCLPEADELVAESWNAATRAERLSKLAAAERLWAEDGAVIGLVQPLGWSLVSPRISGIAPNPGGSHSLRHLSLSPERTFIR
ncbi:ABC transporter substrate-binding protein [Sandaracinobacter sp. RS1-74]|uniref:ABC transporter substrate-binding protein n=1 Tax=Sandaracinobacteroides sayramensis TaxID=2913411 RepID=UPI001EDC0F16|nr:ABC transporter substrate-binding protein [Sandaracinobacteroides sayramensis]MCG2840487.1 ABC transporter substrate-binding protein [Sandaracinobacteroides sayramensis]